MADIFKFAMKTGKRVAEICRLLRSDNDPVKHTGLVRDAKPKVLRCYALHGDIGFSEFSE